MDLYFRLVDYFLFFIIFFMVVKSNEIKRKGSLITKAAENWTYREN